MEFVQSPLNYIDWESELVQARESYEVIQNHGKLAVIMEPVKGGGLSMVPASVEKRLKEMDADASVASWAMRFTGSLDGVICNLSGMSTPDQVKDNINTVKNLKPLTDKEKAHLDFFGELPQEKVILADGTDATEEVLKAEKWLIEHSF